jgi:hypothetical protein
MLPRQLHKLELCKRVKAYHTLDLADELQNPLFVERAVQMNGFILNLIPEHHRTKKIILHAVKNAPDLLKYVSYDYKRDPDVILAACLVDPMCIMHVTSHMIADEVALYRKLAAINGKCIFFGHPLVREDIQVAVAAVTQCADALQYLPVFMCDKWELVSLALQKNPKMFKYASHRIADSEELALEALRYSADVFPFISHRLRTDFTFVLSAVRIAPKVILAASQELASNPLIVQAAVIDCPSLICRIPHLCREVLSDTSILLRLVERDGTIIEYAPEDLQDDEIIGLAAVRSHASAYLFLSPRLKSLRAIVMATVRSCSEYMVDISPTFYTDYEIMYTAVKGYGMNVRYFPSCMVTKEIALMAVSSDGLALSHLPQWAEDEDVVAAAAKQHSAALSYARHSRALVLECAHLDWRTVKYMHADFRTDREIALVLVRKNGRAMRWLAFHGDAELALLALETFSVIFEELDEALVKSAAFQLAAVRLSPGLLTRLHPTGPLMAAAFANSPTPLFHLVTTQDYEKFHAYVTGVVAARREGEAFLGFKTRLHAHGRYSRRLIRGVLDYVGFTTGDTWEDARLAYEKRLV